MTDGCGLVQIEGQGAVTMRPDDVIWIPPGVKHWHGASPDQGMTHFAVAEREAEVATTWMERVDDRTDVSSIVHANIMTLSRR